jgi:hypothetical protein
MKAFEARLNDIQAADFSESLDEQGQDARERGGFEATFTRNVTIKVC